MSKATTIYDLSRLADVSVATVSRALSPDTQHKVAPATLEKIHRVAKEHHYMPNLAAKNLNRVATRTMGVVLPHRIGAFKSDYYMQIMAGISDALYEADYQFKLVMLREDKNSWDRHDFRSVDGVDGLIVTHRHALFSSGSVFERMDIPVVVISDPEPGLKAHVIAADNQMAGAKAAEYLLENKHRKILVLTGPSMSYDSRMRLKGFRKGVSRYKDSIHVQTRRADFAQHRASEVVSELINQGRDFSAIFCCNDEMALGAIEALNQARVKCPQEVSVLGCDGDPRTAMTTPPLSTIHIPLYDMAKAAAELLMNLNKNEIQKPIEHIYPVELIKRSSVGPRK